MNTYQTEIELRLDWSDMDYFKHINNVSYFRFIQSARVHYWDMIQLNDYYRKYNIGPILASCKCDFLKPLHYPGTILVRTLLSQIKNTSFHLHHTMLDADKNIAAEAEDIIVLFDFDNNKKHNIPDILRNNMESLEKRNF